MVNGKKRRVGTQRSKLRRVKIFNPFTHEACTYVKLKKTLYNEEGGKIADVSVKGVATYYIEENAWSAKVKAQVKVPFGF